MIAPKAMSLPPAAGYSGTPLAKKLGVQAGSRVVLLDAPPELKEWLEPLPEDVVFERIAGNGVDIVHLFVTRREILARHLAALRKNLRPGAVLWVSWPKKSSGVASTVTEDTIRELALPLGLVDIKVCAVNAVWSGLKLMLRKELRPLGREVGVPNSGLTAPAPSVETSNSGKRS